TRKNPIRIYPDNDVGGEPKKDKPPAKPMDKPDARRNIDAPIWRTAGDEKDRRAAPDDKEKKAGADDKDKKGGMFDPQADKVKPEGPPITIMAYGGKLIITSEDKEALALAADIVRLFTSEQGGEGDWQIIKLKNTPASDAARVLDEAFNGTRYSQPQGGGG